jgi:hypothetical protein
MNEALGNHLINGKKIDPVIVNMITETFLERLLRVQEYLTTCELLYAIECVASNMVDANNL